jgi:DNA-binding NarL/FixJ family response regulator
VPDILSLLTPGEAAVAERAALGLTNRAIAGELFISVKAVEFHIGHILQKLGLSNRTQLAALLAGLVSQGAPAGNIRVVSGQN